MAAYKLTAATLAAETRRPQLAAWATEKGLSTEGETVASLRKLLSQQCENTIMASIPSKPSASAPSKPAPQKPGAAPQKPAAPVAPPAAPTKPGPPKPGAAPSKPAAAAPPAPAAAAPPAAPAKAGPPKAPPSKPGAAPPAPAAAAPPAASPKAPPGKPGPAAPATTPPKAPSAAPPAPAAVNVDDIIAKVTAAVMKDLGSRIDGIDQMVKAHDGYLKQLMEASFGDAELDENGVPVLNIDGASRQQLLNWYYEFGFELPEGASTEDMRAGLLAARDAEDFAGFNIVNDLDGADAPDPGVTAPTEAAFTKEEVAKANWSRLTEMADQLGVDYSDIGGPPPQPKVLRNRVLSALETLATAPAEGTEGDAPLAEGDAVNVENEGELYPATFVGDAETADHVVVRFPEADEEGNTDFEVPASSVTRALPAAWLPAHLASTNRRARFPKGGRAFLFSNTSEVNMLIIPERARPHFIKVITEATNRGLIHKLIPQLHRLNHYADDSGDGTGRMNVELGYDGADMSFSVTWVRANGPLIVEPGAHAMHGGLIFDSASQEWSTHT